MTDWAPWLRNAAIACALALAGYLLSIWAVTTHSPLVAFDGAVRTFTIDHRTPTGFAVVGVLTWIGSFALLAPALLILGGSLSARRRALGPLVLCTAAVLALGVTVAGGKAVINRERPPIPAGIALAEDGSFPSGHTTTSVVVAGVLLLLLAPILTPIGTRIGWGCLVVFTALAGTSRIYLGSHWFSDVLGGWLLGTTITCALTLAWYAAHRDPTAKGRAPKSPVRAVSVADLDQVRSPD